MGSFDDYGQDDYEEQDYDESFDYDVPELEEIEDLGGSDEPDYPESWYDLIDEGYGVWDMDVSISYGEDA